MVRISCNVTDFVQQIAHHNTSQQPTIVIVELGCDLLEMKWIKSTLVVSAFQFHHGHLLHAVHYWKLGTRQG